MGSNDIKSSVFDDISFRGKNSFYHELLEFKKKNENSEKRSDTADSKNKRHSIAVPSRFPESWNSRYIHSLDNVTEFTEADMPRSRTLSSATSPRVLSPIKAENSVSTSKVISQFKKLLSKKSKKIERRYTVPKIPRFGYLDQGRKRILSFKSIARFVYIALRWYRMFNFRYREDDDDISPYIKGLTFHDYDNQPDLMFDKSKFKAKKSIRVPEETRRILCKRPSERTPQELYSALLTLRNIEAFAAYPNRMQKMIVSVGQYERFEAKRIVLRQGHPGSQYYFMLSGAAVVMVMDNPNSYARPIKHLEKGMDFGEIALTLNIKRQGTVITKEPCELMSIGRRDYRKIFMAGGVRSINDPDQEKFLSCLSFLRSWPIKLLEDAGDKTHFLFFRRGATIVKESALSPWIVVVKSGSISILKKLKRVVPFEWKKKKEVKFVTEKEKKDNYTKRNVLRRHILGELKIPLRQEVEEEDSSFEEYPGKYKMFVHPGDREEQDKASSPNLSQYSESSDNRLQTKSHDSTKKNSFPNIRSKFLTKISEDDSDNTLFGQMDKVPLPPFGIERESTSFDILAPIEPIKKKERSSRRESIMEKEREMMGFEEKTRTVQDDIDAVVKNPEDYTLADLKPEFVRVQTLIKGQVFGLSDLILEQKTSFSVVSNGADVILIDRQFYLKHAPEKLISQMRQELCPYPTDDDLQTRLQLNVDWDAYRNNTMANTLKHLSTKRQLRQSLKI